MTVNWLIHGGQTGVDRGAWAASIALEALGYTIKAGGVMPKDFKDEAGVIPEAVRRNMRPCEVRGYDTRTKENVRACSALLVVVPSRLSPGTSPGTKLTLEYAGTRPGLQVMVADSRSAAAVTSWLAHLPPQTLKAKSQFMLMVAGPRASIWPDGEAVTTELLIQALKRI